MKYKKLLNRGAGGKYILDLIRGIDYIKIMRTILKHIKLSVLIFFIAVMSSGCGSYQEIRTLDTSEKEVAGTYSLILYGGRHGNDLETVAILNKEDAPYKIVPYAPEFDYRIIKDVPAKEALAKAYKFVSFNPYFFRTQVTRIVDSSNGALLGYEIRPLYQPLAYGYYDVLYINYWKKDGKVFVKMKLNYELERKLRGGVGTEWGR